MTEAVSLSPSRVLDFKTCPLLYRFRVVDKLEEPEDPSSARGTLVHVILQALYSIPAHERTLEVAQKLLDEIWEQLETALPQIVYDESTSLIENYFRIEDPTQLTPEQLEWRVEHDGGSVLLRGIIDRVEVLSNGDWILTDYKTSRSPSENYALGSFFGLKFYALICWRAFGVIPSALRLVHLREPEVITLFPTIQMLEGLENQLSAVARAIARAFERDDFRPRPSWACGFCPHRAICPAQSGATDTTSTPVATQAS